MSTADDLGTTHSARRTAHVHDRVTTIVLHFVTLRVGLIKMKPTFGLGFICKGDPVNDIAISSFLGILLTVDGGSGVRGSNLGVMKRFAIGGG